jgi:hypothetical protein
MMSSVTFPNVALTSPPILGPVWMASCSVALPISPARGRMAAADVRKIASSGPFTTSSTTATGTSTSTQSSEGFSERVGTGGDYRVSFHR